MRGIVFPFLVLLASLSLEAAQPYVRKTDRVNPVPRPYDGRVNVTTRTSLYLEVVVPVANLPSGEVDTDSLTVTLIPSGGAPLPVLQAGQTFAPGFTGTIYPDIQDVFSSEIGDGIHVVPDSPLQPGRSYTVQVDARTLDGQVIDPARSSWSFWTRPIPADPVVTFAVDLAGPTVHWNGWFFTGIVKPDFGTSRLFDQLESYDLMSQVSALNPDAWSLQRDWPLTSDYWHNGVFDGNPNMVREMETRQVTAVQNRGQRTLITVTDLEEGPLYGIAPNRPLSDDYHPGDIVSVADREKYELAEVVGVDDNKNTVQVVAMATAPSAWILDYAGSHPADLPETPDNFTLPLCYLRKMNPVGTPVYYWTRIDDEWDIVHGQHGRRLQVNFSYTPLALSSEPVPASTGGHGSTSPPKDWDQWHEFVRQTVFHLIDRYGTATADFYYSIGNENNFSLFWTGGKDGFYELYDYTVNAILTAFEDRGMDTAGVQVGGIEAADLGGIGWIRDAMYHAAGAADKPGGGIVEQNFVCADPSFTARLASRVQALCTAHGGKGSPLDFVSIHEYQHASKAVADLTRLRDDALAIDPVFFHDLNVTSFENTPDWIPRTDPASREMFEGNGYFPTWAADWMQRMVIRAESDPRYARHEAVVTVWPMDYNGNGQSSVTGLIRVDDDGDGTEDRVATIRKGFFNYIELLAHMSRDLDALPAQDVEGIRFAGVRSPSAGAHRLLLYSHDKYDTESAEEAAFSFRLQLTGVPWENVTVQRYRLDRDHSSPFHAYQALPVRGGDDVYLPSEIADLEQQDDLVQDGAPQDYPVAAGALELTVPTRVNGTVLVELFERDLDSDGIGDSLDNCPGTANPSQSDADADARGSACDCDDLDPGVWAVPGEVPGLVLSHHSGTGITDLDWQPPAIAGGSIVLFDVLRSGDRSDFGGGTTTCLESDDGSDYAAADADTPGSGETWFYLVRAENGCGAGSLGAGRSGSDCP